jgi:molybdenum cofactor guanylyltransferase
MNLHPHILGVILAGGTARRLFPESHGGDKGLVPLAGKPMLAHVRDRFAPQVSRLILNANGPADRFDRFGLEIVPDAAPGDQGPLAGLAAAFAWVRRTGASFTSVVTVSIDVPFLPLDLVQRLTETAPHPGKVAIASSDGRSHPVIGLWPLDLAEDLDNYLISGRRSAEAFAKRHGAVAVSFPPGEFAGQAADPFFNVNTPDDLAFAEKLLSGQT